jgi:hypothetical protein
MLTPRGEHLYFIANTNVTLILMTPHMAPAHSRKLSWSERVASLCYVRPLRGTVVESCPPLVASAAFLRLTRALITAPMSRVSKLILDAVVGRISRGTGTIADTWNLIALLGGRYSELFELQAAGYR